MPAAEWDQVQGSPPPSLHAMESHLISSQDYERDGDSDQGSGRGRSSRCFYKLLSVHEGTAHSLCFLP